MDSGKQNQLKETYKIPLLIYIGSMTKESRKCSFYFLFLSHFLFGYLPLPPSLIIRQSLLSQGVVRGERVAQMQIRDFLEMRV